MTGERHQTSSSYRPESRNLVELLHTAVERYAQLPLYAVKQGAGWRWTNYREGAELVAAFRAGLASLGIAPGDRVAVIANNCPEWAIGAYATYTLGACYVPMYEHQLAREWEFVLSDSGAMACLVANTEIARVIERLRPGLPELRYVIPLDAAAADPHSYAALIEHGRLHPVAAAAPADDTLALLVYTSGTTGKPKGVKLTHYNLASNACGAVGITDVGVGDRSLAFLPWAHVFGGCIELNGAIANGGCGVICTDPSRLAEYLPEVQPTVLFGVPRVWNHIYSGVRARMASQPRVIQQLFERALMARGKQRRGERLALAERLSVRLAQKLIFPRILAALGGKLRCAYSGAAKLSREVAEFLEDLGIQLYDGYGMTEASGCITINPRGQARAGSVGKPIHGVWLEIDRSRTSTSADEGEIIVYGAGVMQGYWNQDELTRDTLTERGGLRTGDLGRLDADGYLYLTGRVKELYKLENGKYVAPAPLEELITQSPFVAECVVYGADRPYNVALIFPDMPALQAWASHQGIAARDNDGLLSDARVRGLYQAEVDRIGATFKPYERIQKLMVCGGALSIDNGLLTPSLKVKRAQVLSRYQTVLDAAYSGAAAQRVGGAGGPERTAYVSAREVAAVGGAAPH